MDFNIETVGHYTRNNEMQLIEAPPPILNCQPETRQIKPFYSLKTYEYIDSSKVEEHMKSLLQYMLEKRLHKKPNFVTQRQLMASLACGDMEQLFIIPFMGILFLLPKGTSKLDDESSKKKKPPTSAKLEDEPKSDAWKKESIKKGFQIGGNYHHFMTRKSENEPIPTERNSFKAVLKATIDGQSVVYSGEIDALGGNGEHIELKAVCGGTPNPHFWRSKSKWVYFQAFFGNVKTILVGARTDQKGKDPKTGPPHKWPEYSLYKVQNLQREDIPGQNYLEKKKEEGNNYEWKVETGGKNIHEFFNLVKEECSQKRVCYVATSKKSGDDVEWTFKRADENQEDKEKVEAFRETLRRILGTDEKNILK